MKLIDHAKMSELVRMAERSTIAAQSPAPLETVDVDAQLREIEQRLLARRSASLEFEQWLTIELMRQAPRECPEHPGSFFTFDEKGTLLRSWERFVDTGRREVVVALDKCAACDAEIREAQRIKWMTAAGVPPILIDCTVDSWKPKNADDAKSFATVRDFAARPRGTLILISAGYGCGKSHLAVGCLRSKGAGIFRKQFTLMGEVRASYSTGRTQWTINRFCHAPLLVLDEVGITTGGRDELPVIHEILDYRYTHRLPTVITANMTSAKQLEPVLGERLFDRLRESSFAVVTITAGTERPTKRAEYIA